MPVFKFGENDLSYEVVRDDIWLRGKDILDMMATKNHEEPYNFLKDVMSAIKISSESDEAELVSNMKKQLIIGDDVKDMIIEDLKKKIADLERQLCIIEPKYVPNTPDKQLNNVFYVIKKNLQEVKATMDQRYRFYVLRVQKRHVEESLKKVKKNYPDYKVFFEVEDPNAVNLFNRFRELRKVATCENHLDTDMSDDELLDVLKKFCKVRYDELGDIVKSESGEFIVKSEDDQEGV